MKADRKTTKLIGRGKSKTQKAQTTHKAAAPKPHEKKTEHNQVDGSVRQSRDFLLALSRAAQSVQRARTPDDIYRAVGEQIKALGLDAVIFTFDNDRQNLLVSYTTYAAQIIRASEKIVGFSTRDFRLPVSPESIYGRIIAAEKAEYISWTGDIVAEALPKVLRPLVGQLMRVLKIDQSIMAPLHMDGVVLGMLAISGAGLSHEDVTAVETFAAQVVISLINARLAQQAQEELEERKRAEKNLRESEERFRALIENASDIILTITVDGNLNYVSPAALRITGYQANEVIGRNIVEFIHADDLPLARQALASRSKISGLASHPIELRFHHKDGMWRIVEILGNNLLENPAVKGIVLNVRDITERKQAEEALHQAEIHYRSLVEQTPAVIYTVDPRQPDFFVYISRQIETLSGYSPQAWIEDAQLWNNLIHIEDRKRVLDEEIRTNNTGEPFNIEYRLVHRDGHLVWVHEKARQLHDASGQPTVWQGFMLDITERKRAEEKLRLSEEQFSKAFYTSPAGMTITRIADGKFIDVNDSFLRMFEFSRGEVLGYTSTELNMWTPEERKKLIQHQLLSGGLRDFELQVRAKSGRIVHILFSSKPMELEGEACHITTMIDITERKRAQEKLHVQLDRLSALREIDQMISSTFGLSMSLNTLITHASRLLAVDAVSVLLLNSAFNRLEYGVGRGFRSPAIKTTSIKLGESYAGRAAIERRVIEIPNIADEPNDLFQMGFMKDERFVSYYGAPLIVKGKVVGVLELFHRSLVDRDLEWHDFFSAVAGQAAIAIENAKLFENLQVSNSDLFQAYDATIEGWSRALDLRDKETEGHSLRVTAQTLELARIMGLSGDHLVNIRRGALLHDIGKMGVPDNILLKAEDLTEDEWKIMRKHPTFGFELLSPIRYLKSAAIDIPYCHHEKWDGTGYPRGLKGEQIPLSARIFAVIDVWDALTSDRSYRPAWSKEQALDHIRSLAGIHFDPAVVKAFLDSDLH